MMRRERMKMRNIDKGKKDMNETDEEQDREIM
jgi:hypothetical protein